MNLNFRAANLTLLIWSFFGLGDVGQLVAQTNAAAPAHPLANERFLFVIETSSATEKRAENIQKVAGAIIASGLTGHMLPGATLGVWTFNDQLSTGKFPLRVWTPESRQHTAREVAQFLQQQEFKKSPRLTGVQAALTNLLAQSERITVIYITSGSQPLTGTPQDKLIAETFRSNAEKQRGLQMPFVTILRATKGQVVAAAVTTPPWSLEVPEYPDVPKPDPEALKPPTPEPPPPQPVAPRISPNVLSPTNVIYSGRNFGAARNQAARAGSSFRSANQCCCQHHNAAGSRRRPPISHRNLSLRQSLRRSPIRPWWRLLKLNRRRSLRRVFRCRSCSLAASGCCCFCW
jgi:hypothetical protein